MSFAKNLVASVVVLGGLGAGIDFLLSATQKLKIKDWLLAKWVEFDDRKLSNFSEKEAMYFVELSDRRFCARLLSSRRLLLFFPFTSLIPDERGWDRLQWILQPHEP